MCRSVCARCAIWTDNGLQHSFSSAALALACGHWYVSITVCYNSQCMDANIILSTDPHAAQASRRVRQQAYDPAPNPSAGCCRRHRHCPRRQLQTRDHDRSPEEGTRNPHAPRIYTPLQLNHHNSPLLFTVRKRIQRAHRILRRDRATWHRRPA